jgi:NTP pyrophosphatase (non-canonical NTP hydrolase)
MGNMSLTFGQYQKRALSTAFYPHVSEGAHPIAVTYCILGLNGEAGEIAEKLKKTWREEGQMLRFTQEQRRQVLMELGDLLWYVSQLASELGCSLEAVANWNLEKLAARASHGIEGWTAEYKQHENG